MTYEELYARAKAVTGSRRLSDNAECGSVGAVLETAAGNVYVGVCIDTSSSMGFCAEHAAAAAMVTAGESQVVRMLAVCEDGRVFPPCGRCRQFITQLNPRNKDALVCVEPEHWVTLAELLPWPA